MLDEDRIACNGGALLDLVGVVVVADSKMVDEGKVFCDDEKLLGVVCMDGFVDKAMVENAGVV